MEIDVLQNLLFWLILSWVLWWMIGIDKDIGNHKSDKSARKSLDYNFWSVRSFSLIAILGSLMVYCDTIFATWYIFVLAWFLLTSVFVWIHYIHSVFANKDISPATEFVAILTYFIGVLVFLWLSQFAIIFAIILTFLISSKDTLEWLGKYISRDELRTTLKFAAIAFIILPLLPDQRFSLSDISNFTFGRVIEHPLTTFAFFNPYSIWFFVVVMSGVSYLWYVLTKFLGSNSSIILSSALGWMVSSTATTASMTQKSKEDPKNINSYVIGTLLASCIMFVRVFAVVLFFSFPLFLSILMPWGIMFGIFLCATLYFYIKSKRETVKKIETVENVRSPFRIAPALKFAGLVVIIKFISWVWIIYKDIWGEWFFYSALWIVSGLADVDAITQAMAVDSDRGLITFGVASSTILLAVMSNNLVKWSIAWRLGHSEFWTKVMLSFLLSIAGWIIAIAGRALLS